MAFHFNWSPLIADTDRVRHMLTASLNRTPLPPIIVGAITVSSLNLGSLPPSLEILEIGDLAQDRFRGIFKVKYEGDAYLTLQTRVQANPLNTFLSTKPSFASPTPLAAGSGLTIPLQITLSDIRLSGFVILVFSKQKGITLVFRNDPLESLKVSSTFDSIPFVRDYLQRTIEAQLRVLFVEDLPAIIHRLSLKVFTEEEQKPRSEEEKEAEAEKDKEAVLEYVESEHKDGPEQQDSERTVLSPIDPISLLDVAGEAYATFSQKNLVRLAALSESQRTLSLFTPNIRDAVFRAWASAAERSEGSTSMFPQRGYPTTLSRIQSTLNMQHGTSSLRRADTMSSATSHTSEVPSHATRPSLAGQSTHSYVSTSYSLSSGQYGTSRTHRTRKRKNRVVNLRRNNDGATDGASETVSVGGSSYDDSASKSESRGSRSVSGEGVEINSTVPTSSSVHHHERDARGIYEGEVHTPNTSPQKRATANRKQSIKDVDQLEDVVAVADTAKYGRSGTLRAQRRPVTPMHQAAMMNSEVFEDTIGGAESSEQRQVRPMTPHHLAPPFDEMDADPTPRQSMYLPKESEEHQSRPHGRRQQTLPLHPSHNNTRNGHTSNAPPSLQRSASELSISDLLPSYPFSQEAQSDGGSTGGILEQAWMTKMAAEIARRVAQERERRGDGSAEAMRRREKAKELVRGRLGEETPPPAYTG